MPAQPLNPFRLPSPRSFRGRYLYISALFALVLVGAAVLGWHYVDHTARVQVAQIQHRGHAADAVGDMLEQTQALETSLQRFVILPDTQNRKAVERAAKLQAAACVRLTDTRWVQQDDSILHVVQALERDRTELARLARELMSRREDVELWFPAMAIMRDQMLPAITRFNDALSLALDELRAETAAALPRGTLFAQIRYPATRMVSEYRLLVANRFGIFSGDSESGMRARAKNIETYAGRIESLFEQIRHAARNDELSLQQHESLETMLQAFEHWYSGYQRVRTILSSDDWRTDVALLRDRMDPLFDQVHQRLSTLQLELGVGSAKAITGLTSIARQLSNFVLVLAAGGVLVILLGFVIFHRTLLGPIAQTAQALKAEARGHEGVVVPQATAEETRDLAEAFDEMREQVRRRQEHLDFMAHHDPLTALPNRVLFRDRLEHAMNHAEREGYQVGLLFLDLDRFKQINDSLGHHVGDHLLVAVADRLRETTRDVDTVARLGGDEFAIVLEQAEDLHQVATVAQKILEAFHEPFQVDDRQLHTTASIGIALFPTDSRDAGTLIKDADAAMYHAKDGGRNLYRFFSAEMTARVAAHLELETQLRIALAHNRLELHLQPIMNLGDGSIHSCETLLRWNHPQRGPIGPAEFIPVLEETGLILPVASWSLESICEYNDMLRKRGLDAATMSLNLSARLLQGKRFLETLLETLEQRSMDPKRLIVEITEDALIQDFRAADKSLRALKDMGVRVALDDFGTGQSSLNHLRGFPIDIVKIDRDFVRDVPEDRYDSDLVKAIIALAHSLGIQVIAEGVETERQLQFLRDHGCDAMQGFLLAKPMPPDQLVDFLASASVNAEALFAPVLGRSL